MGAVLHTTLAFVLVMTVTDITMAKTETEGIYHPNDSSRNQ